jgi:hypothetical protein
VSSPLCSFKKSYPLYAALCRFVHE